MWEFAYGLRACTHLLVAINPAAKPGLIRQHREKRRDRSSKKRGLILPTARMWEASQTTDSGARFFPGLTGLSLNGLGKLVAACQCLEGLYLLRLPSFVPMKLTGHDRGHTWRHGRGRSCI